MSKQVGMGMAAHTQSLWKQRGAEQALGSSKRRRRRRKGESIASEAVGNVRQSRGDNSGRALRRRGARFCRRRTDPQTHRSPAEIGERRVKMLMLIPAPEKAFPRTSRRFRILGATAVRDACWRCSGMALARPRRPAAQSSKGDDV